MKATTTETRTYRLRGRARYMDSIGEPIQIDIDDPHVVLRDIFYEHDGEEIEIVIIAPARRKEDA